MLGVSSGPRVSLVRQLDDAFFGFGVFAVEDGDMADDASEACAEFLGDVGGEGFLLVFVIVEADLDELVCVEGLIDGRKDGGGEALFADEYGGLEVVGLAS